MTPAELRKSHDRMAQFLLHLLVFSDKKGHAKRTPIVEVHYQQALMLVRKAGLKYDPPDERC
jgi:hypothetical protein